MPFSFAPLQNLRRDRLSNGLRVFLKPDPTWPLVSIQAWVRVGSVDEKPAEAGISHILEHMVFKGTAHHRAVEISHWVESLGGVLNAETTKEYTHYYIDVPSAGAPKAVHLLAELLNRASLDPADWERECPVILEEIKRRNDDPDAVLWDQLNEALFENPAWRRSVIGTPSTVASVSSETLRGFYGKYYTASQCLLVVTGAFPLQTMRRWIRQEFGRMPAGDPPRPRVFELDSGARRHIRLQKPVRQSYAAFGFSTPPANHPDQEALDLVAAILGEGRGARLVHQLQEEKKLVWSISATNMTHDGPGIFAIFAECDPGKRAAFEAELKKLLRVLRRSPPTEWEITRAKNVIQTAWLQGLESTHNQASTIGLYAIENHLDRFQQYLPKVLSLTRHSLEDVIERYFSSPMGSAVIEA